MNNMLSDSEIRSVMSRRQLEILPHPEDLQFQPASIDLKLGNQFKWYTYPKYAPMHGADFKACSASEQAEMIHLDQSEPEHFMQSLVLPDDGRFVVTPNMFVLATTHERVKLSKHLVARVEGRSSIGRKGLIIHATAGFIDPGFEGHITLEIANLNLRGIVLRPGMRICQLSITRVDGLVERPYGHPELRSRYQGQVGTTASRVHENEEPKR